MDGLFFTSPENLSFVNGRVSIIGSIPEEDFVSARLQYGMGLNPRAWIQIGPDILEPADSSRLEFWDTTDLDDGIYALQLILIMEEQQVEKVSLIISVDNTPPEMEFVTDLFGGEIPYKEDTEILFEVEFENYSEIDLVEFFLNDDLLSIRKTTPFIVPWLMVPGNMKSRSLPGIRPVIR